MGLRAAINSHAATATALAVVILSVALGVMLWSSADRGPRAADNAYFYDPIVDELFLGDPGQLPPIEGPSGERVAVRAHLFSCGPCPAPAEVVGLGREEIEAATGAYVAYLTRYTDEALELAAGRERDAEAMRRIHLEGRLVRSPRHERWVAAHEGAGRRIQAQARLRCGEAPAQACEPDG